MEANQEKKETKKHLYQEDYLDEDMEKFAKKKELQNKVLIKIIEKMNHKPKNTSDEKS
jgi:hypothetical protein